MHRWCLLNLTVQGFSLNLTVRGVSNKHCLLTFFIVACVAIYFLQSIILRKGMRSDIVCPHILTHKLPITTNV